jgi:demethylmenaquinone methyltransferase/2-methoxy-6-polyprenyl-1,4-benzoquinol methylase
MSGRVRLRGAFTSPSAKERYVRTLFATIADRYDLITVLLSFGLDRRWKRRLADLGEPLHGARVLDLACGTGDIAFEAAGRGASVVGLDVTHRMLQLARAKAQATPRARFLQGDMMSLPFASGVFDVVTTGYGLRNVPVLEPALVEIYRVLRPGGTLVSLDFNNPSHPAVRAIYLAYLTVVGGALGWILHRDADTYRYIPASIRRYPGAPGVVQMLNAAGFEAARWRPTLGGLMAIHVARRPIER